MGLLVDGVWSEEWYDTRSSGGKFVRATSHFRNWVTPSGDPGPTGTGGFVAESGRYHLYVSHACPWAHRTLIFRALKGLAPHIDVSVVHPLMLDEGWTFERDFAGTTGDRVLGNRYLREVYIASEPKVTGRVTVPILWDTRTACIVSNESSEILRMFNSAFDGLTGNTLDFYPASLRPGIDEVNERVYHRVNNGVYKVGFATTQEAYREALGALFEELDRLEEHLKEHRYLVGEQITEADWRLFVTMIRFDPVYVGHFKCNLRQIAEYPALHAYLRELYQHPGVRETVHMDHIKVHYYASHTMINPTQVVPDGPVQDLEAPHGRGGLS